jgi:hypothetical protein
LFLWEQLGYVSKSGIEKGRSDQAQWMEDINGDGPLDFCCWVGEPKELHALLGEANAFAEKDVTSKKK